ncbi:hypothetical protein Tco_0535914 [Tanacetum coccineum]
MLLINPDDLDAYASIWMTQTHPRVALMGQISKGRLKMHSLRNPDITSDSNIIPYSQYLSETQQETVQNSNSLLNKMLSDIVLD